MPGKDRWAPTNSNENILWIENNNDFISINVYIDFVFVFMKLAPSDISYSYGKLFRVPIFFFAFIY